MIITFTGHRPDKVRENDPQNLICAMEEFAEYRELDLLKQSYITGGCPGFDTIALEILLNMKVPKSQILVAVPVKGFEVYSAKDFPAEGQKAFRLNRTPGVTMTEVGGEGTFGQKCWRRNEYMVKKSHAIFTNYRGGRGGTKNTLDLALLKGIPVIYIH